ncbi:MAG: hypothetical protein IKV99_03370 [Oscillospiraceae bacterium]|nr:hypothetical protein [Oscillospiraceae bacterium]
MKTTPIFKILSAAVLLAVVFYFAVQGYHYFSDPINTTFVYASHEWEAIETEGFLVRDEETFHSDMTTLHHALREGEKVGKNQTLAIAFPDSGALNRVERLDALEMQAQQLSFALESFLDGDAALKLDDNIREDLTAFHQAIATGDYTRGEDERTALKTAILKRDYTYTSQEQIEFDLNAVEQKIKEEESLLNGTDITAPKSGIFSAVCDGYEGVLTPALLGEVSPSALTAIQPEAQRANVGKLIYGDTWYYVTVITQEQAQMLEDRSAISVQFAKGFTAPFSMAVRHISEPENGKCVLWLSTREYMAQTTLLRQQSASLLLHEYEGLRLPDKALRVNEEGKAGVYCVIGARARYKGVSVLYHGDGYVLVRPTDTGETSLLRQGDQVIVTTAELYDGKVIG